MSTRVAHKSTRVVFPDRVEPATLVVEEGKFVAFEPHDYGGDCHDWKDLAILPGAIDTHVHFNEPGRTHWEGWKSGTQAAVAGGVTTVVEMPLNSIPSTVDSDSLRLKIESMAGKLHCDVGLWGGAVPGNSGRFQEMLEEGVLGLKCFLSDPGTAEFQNLDESSLREAMLEIARLDSILLVHAEWPDQLVPVDPAIPGQEYRAWLSTRPVEAERAAIEKIVQLSRETGCRSHIVHVASDQVLDVLEGSQVTSETCAHYLSFCAEEIVPSATNFKCAPPIRERVHQSGLWEALRAGKITMVTSDHSPCPPELKNDSFLESWGGIAGVQLLLQATWTGAVARGFTLVDLAKWLSREPAKLAGIESRKGSLEVGLDADFVIFDPEAEFECGQLFHRYQGSPYQGRRWRGTVVETHLRGQVAYSPSDLTSPRGHLITSQQLRRPGID